MMSLEQARDLTAFPPCIYEPAQQLLAPVGDHRAAWRAALDATPAEIDFYEHIIHGNVELLHLSFRVCFGSSEEWGGEDGETQILWRELPDEPGPVELCEWMNIRHNTTASELVESLYEWFVTGSEQQWNKPTCCRPNTCRHCKPVDWPSLEEMSKHPTRATHPHCTADNWERVDRQSTRPPTVGHQLSLFRD